MIDEAGCDKIDAAGVKSIKVYSVMTCSSKEGVCATCYGRDLSRGKMVHVGEASPTWTILPLDKSLP